MVKHRIPGTGGTGAIDRTVLGEWLDEDDAAIDALLVVFRDSAQAEFTRLRQALDRADLAEFAQTAHRLRGGALAMGAPGLARAATVAEEAGKARNAEACAASMADLEAQMDRMAADVSRERPSDR